SPSLFLPVRRDVGAHKFKCCIPNGPHTEVRNNCMFFDCYHSWILPVAISELSFSSRWNILVIIAGNLSVRYLGLLVGYFIQIKSTKSRYLHRVGFVSVFLDFTKHGPLLLLIRPNSK
ncbi:hypothetical protein EG68_09387, partial [Paragonimus skrjabini miyazakii]